MNRKLNIGANWPRGQYKRDGWINLDTERFCKPTVCASGLNLPFKDNSFNEIHCVHVIEHLTRDKPQFMINEMYRVLEWGGKAYVEVPNFEKIIELLHDAFKLKDLERQHKWITSIYGKNERKGMAHYWGFTTYKLKSIMEMFNNIEITDDVDKMISTHYRQEPVLLAIGTK